MVIRPVERSDVSALMQLASKTGGGLTSLPANEATLSARIERAIKTWQGELPKSEQGYVFVLEDSETGTVAGICAIEVAVGLNDPWYNYRVGTLVHASKELNVYNALPTLFLSNDHTGSSELCTLFLDPDWRKEGNGYLLSKSRFMFMAAFRDKFNDKVVAEMRGVIDEHGYSPFWQSLGKRFFSMDFSRADFLCGTGQKAFIAELMPKHPIYTHFLSQEAQDVIGQVHPQTAPARAVLEKEGFRYRNYIDIFDGGPTLECDIDRVRAEYGDDLAVVCYVNSTAEAKTWSDVCVTSSNAVKICSNLPQRNILFIPDMNLGRYVASQLPDKHVILNKGYCPRHVTISVEQIIDLEEAHPDAVVMAHPECPADVLAEADYIGSTKGMIEHAAASDAQEFIVCTVVGIIRELELRTQGTGKRFHFPATTPRCENMDLVTLPKLAACLRNPAPYEVYVGDSLAPAARLTLERMLEYAAK